MRTHPYDINDDGQITGSSNSRAFLWREGIGMTELPSIFPDAGFLEGIGINSAGTIVGHAEALWRCSAGHAAIYRASVRDNFGGDAMNPLPEYREREKNQPPKVSRTHRAFFPCHVPDVPMSDRVYWPIGRRGTPRGELFSWPK